MIRVIHAPQVIGMHEHPTKALKEKQQSSIAIGFHLLAKAQLMHLSVQEIPVRCLLVHYTVSKPFRVYFVPLFHR